MRSVGNGRFPVPEIFVLFLEATKGPAFDRILFHVVNTSFNLAFVTRHPRLGRQQHRAVMFTERLQLWIQIGVVAVSFDDGRFEIVGNDRLGNATEMHECIFKTLNQVVGGLTIDEFTVRLSGMTQHDAENMGPTAPSLAIDHSARRCRSRFELLRLEQLPFAERAMAESC